MHHVPSPATPSRRSVLAAGTLAALPLALTAAPAEAAPGARRKKQATPAGAVTSPVPDPLPYRGSWQRTADGGQRAAAPAGGSALAVTEHRTGARAGFALRVAADPATPHARGGLVLRAAADGSSGYAVTLEPATGQVRLTDLADGGLLASGATAPGELLEVTTDGPALTVRVDGRAALATSDHRHRAGHTGLYADSGTVLLGPPRAWTVTTDLTGWTGDPGWTPTPLGLTADAPDGTNLRALAAEEAYDTSLQADVVVHDPYAVAALLIRADATGTRGYAVEVDPNQGRLRLYRIDGNTTLATHPVPVLPGTVHRLRVEAEGRRLRVHRQGDFLRPDGYTPVIDTEDPGPAPHLSGRHGLLAYNGRVSYDNVTVPGADEHPGGATESGTWTRDLAGLRGHEGVRTAPAPTGPGLVASADVRFAGARAAGLLVRGHTVLLDRQAGAVRLRDHARGTLLASAPPPVRPLRDGDLVRLEVHIVDGEFTVLADGAEVLRAPAATTGATVGLVAEGGTAFFREVYAGDARDHFTEPYRPAYHHSKRSGSACDPNGLVWFEGEYHLFHQDQGRWAHAVSTDLLHWRSLPLALDWNAHGHCWSGSAVADLHDASGLFGGAPGLIAYYTGYHPDRPGGNQSVRAAFSTDRGRSWQEYGGPEPLVGNPGGPDGGWDFRDPKVLRDEPRDQWVMVVSGGDHVRFLTSRDLLRWTHVSSFGYGPWVTGGVWECPDLFALPVDGDPGRTAWVLTLSTGAVRATDGSAAVYLTGTWDGTAFTPDQAPGGWLRSDHGRDFYAAITFDNTPDGRRIWLGWTTNWDYPFSAPTGRWQGQHSVPRELSLTAGPAGHPVLRQTPVAELAALRTGSTVRTGLTAGPGLPDPCSGLGGFAYEIEAELALPATGGASDCAFLLRGKDGKAVRVGYDPGRARLYLDRAGSGRTDFTRWFAGRSEAPLTAETAADGSRTVRLRILVDSSSVEVFGGRGEAVLTGLVLPDPDARGLSFTATGGTVRLTRLAHHPLASTCRLGGAPGRALPPAPPEGAFRTDLGALTVTPAGRWESTGAGRTCVFDRDSDALSTRRFADLELTTLLRLGGPDGVRGAASLLWRASADGADGYVLNVDPDLRAVRLVVRRGGSFDDAAALARVPLLVRHGVTYHLRVVHQGTRIQVFLDGDRIIDRTDPAAAHASGHVGLNVFGGRAGYQDTYAKEL
ncbi:GH32 C-terminal domain-containing protein [Streptomyces sp. NPDC085479]|uniref:GH32 C-terminal domain-containing protein n=1 Tax=Streptomyces sp. NPDC085479 TaxID=3365726 RepID=UPI0037D0A091